MPLTGHQTWLELIISSLTISEEGLGVLPFVWSELPCLTSGHNADDTVPGMSEVSSHVWRHSPSILTELLQRVNTIHDVVFARRLAMRSIARTQDLYHVFRLFVALLYCVPLGLFRRLESSINETEPILLTPLTLPAPGTSSRSTS